MRISATNIDSYRYYRAHEEKDLKSFLADLRKENPATQAMMAGRALHKILELSDQGSIVEHNQDEFSFEFNAHIEISLPKIRELKAEQKIIVNDKAVTLVGVVDGIQGNCVFDHKTTASAFDAEKYLDTFQWRIYLELFQADIFQWNVFQWREDTKKPKRYIITDFHQLRAYRYPDMRKDIEHEIALFLDFARHYLPELYMQEAA